MIWVILVVLIGLFVLYIVYDKVSWMLAKYDDAKRSIVIIARHIKAFRRQIADAPNKGKLDETFQDILIQSANIAYVLGGVKLMYEVNDARPFEKEQPSTQPEDTVEDDSRNLQVIKLETRSTRPYYI